jgi:hypothetical protein
VWGYDKWQQNFSKENLNRRDHLENTNVRVKETSEEVCLLNKTRRPEDIWGAEGITPRILNLGIRKT